MEHIFVKIESLGFELSIEKCEFGILEINFLGHTITGDGIKPNKDKLEKFLSTVKLPKSVKQTRRLIGFHQYFQKIIPNLAEKLQPFFKLLRKESTFILTSEHHISLEKLKEDLEKACSLSLMMAKSNCQFVIMCDASFYAAGFVFLIEDYSIPNNTTSKSYAPVAFGSLLFSPAQLKHSIYVKEFLSVQYAFETFEHYIWGVSNKPIIVLTDNKIVTRFFQAKRLPGKLWNTVDYVLSFNFVLGHIPGKANAAADYLSRVHINPATKMKMKLDDRIPLHKIQIDVLSNTPDNSIMSVYTTEEIAPQATHHKNQEIIVTNAHNEIEAEITELSSLHINQICAVSKENPLDKLDLSESLLPLNVEKEQRNDPEIVKVKTWILNKIKPETTYSTYDLKKYHKHLSRLTLEHGILYRKFFDHTGQNYHKQFVVPKHLRTELLYRIHNSKMKGLWEYKKQYVNSAESTIFLVSLTFK